MSTRFEDKVAVVTGAAGGIGRATVQRLAEEGAHVVAIDLEEDALRSSLEEIAGDVFQVPADVTVESDVKRYLGEARSRFGGVDCIFHNAGIFGAMAQIEDYPPETYQQIMTVNVFSVFLGMKYAIPFLRERGGGAIVNTASTAGVAGNSMNPVYTASKHAIVGLTRATALRHAAEGIRINAVCPGPIQTAMLEVFEEGLSHDSDRRAARSSILARIPAARYGKPEEVAAIVAFLLSNEADFIHGSLYTIDGGMTPF